MLPQDMQESVITASGSLRHVTFRINARKPGNSDFDKVKTLKKSLLSKSKVKSRNLLLKWYGYEVALHLLMQKLGRQCLSRTECEFIGHKLEFDIPSLNAALEYLRELNILSFFDVLPSVIFASSQVILDKITELVAYHLELKGHYGAMDGAQRKFLQQGIMSLEILKSPRLSKHYTEGLFEPHNLLAVLVSKLVVTKVSQDEFMMPCVMDMRDIFPSPPPIDDHVLRSSFALHFSKKSPMLGVFCCTVAYLLSNAGWELLTENDDVVMVARNSVAFKMPKRLPGKLTFIDPVSSYFLVEVELPAIVHSPAKIYQEIRDTFFTAMMQALGNLNYEVKMPTLSFLCPEQSSKCSRSPHLASMDNFENLLTCCLKPEKVFHP